MLRWPDRRQVDAVVRSWAAAEARRHPRLRRLGYFGSYARGDWGVGSDLDLVAIVGETELPFERRALDWDLQALPVPADLLVYTEGEWLELGDRGGRLAKVFRTETVWVWEAARARKEAGPVGRVAS